MSVKECAECLSLFEDTSLGRPAKYCTDCRSDRARRRSSSSMQRTRANKARINAVAESLRETLEPSEYWRLDEYLDSLELDQEPPPLVPDRMPPGTRTIAGPDEGSSTYFEELAEVLDMRSVASLIEPWHTQNPEWFREPYMNETDAQYDLREVREQNAREHQQRLAHDRGEHSIDTAWCIWCREAAGTLPPELVLTPSMY